jgi:hypothetical protein
MPNGEMRIVPPPDARGGIVDKIHRDVGHFGARRTAHLVMTAYWWSDIHREAGRRVKECEVCNRVKATFGRADDTLHPLPIEGLFFRWGVDLCGPFPTTARGNKYVMVCIEHFSKFLLLVPLPDKQAATTAAAFRQHVLGVFGACAEVVTDQGSEFKGAFQDLLAQSLIDHSFATPDHPQTDGLAERAVQTCKKALAKYAHTAGKRTLWDDHLPAISLGYNASAQQSTRVSPCYLLFGRHPTLPAAHAEHFADAPLMRTSRGGDDEEEDVTDELLSRAQKLRDLSAHVGENLRIAQHRDTLRYAKTRSGAYHPRLRKYAPGQYVYVRESKGSDRNLGIDAQPLVRRIRAVSAKGFMRLVDPDGRHSTVNVSRCSPCHTVPMGQEVDYVTLKPAQDTACLGCGFPDDEATMLLCDSCPAAWHTGCLVPPLVAVPQGTWQCPVCTEESVPLPRTSSAVRCAPRRGRQHRTASRSTPNSTAGLCRRRSRQARSGAG